jgi:hypothetical protein
VVPPLQASALGTKARWTAIPAGTLPGSTLQPIPEPDTAWLMLTGFFGLGTYVYRSRSVRRLFDKQVKKPAGCLKTLTGYGILLSKRNAGCLYFFHPFFGEVVRFD